MSFSAPTNVVPDYNAVSVLDQYRQPVPNTQEVIGVQSKVTLNFGTVANTDLAFIIDYGNVKNLPAIKSFVIDARYLNVDCLLQVDDSIGIPYYIEANTIRQLNVPAFPSKRIKISAVPIQTDSYGQFNNVFGTVQIYSFDYVLAELIQKRRANKFIASIVQNAVAGQFSVAFLAVSNPGTTQQYLNLRKIIMSLGTSATGATTAVVETNVQNPYTLSAFATSINIDSSTQLAGIGLLRSGTTAVAAPNGDPLDQQSNIWTAAMPYEFKFPKPGIRLPGPQAGLSIVGSVGIYVNTAGVRLNATFIWDEFNDSTVSQ